MKFGTNPSSKNGSFWQNQREGGRERERWTLEQEGIDELEVDEALEIIGILSLSLSDRFLRQKQERGRWIDSTFFKEEAIILRELSCEEDESATSTGKTSELETAFIKS